MDESYRKPKKKKSRDFLTTDQKCDRLYQEIQNDNSLASFRHLKQADILQCFKESKKIPSQLTIVLSRIKREECERLDSERARNSGQWGHQREAPFRSDYQRQRSDSERQRKHLERQRKDSDGQRTHSERQQIDIHGPRLKPGESPYHKSQDGQNIRSKEATHHGEHMSRRGSNQISKIDEMFKMAEMFSSTPPSSRQDTPEPSSTKPAPGQGAVSIGNSASPMPTGQAMPVAPVMPARQPTPPTPSGQSTMNPSPAGVKTGGMGRGHLYAAAKASQKVIPGLLDMKMLPTSPTMFKGANLNLAEINSKLKTHAQMTKESTTVPEKAVEPEVEPAKPKPVNIEWEEYDPAKYGHFFINKVYLDAEKQAYWIPEHIKGTITEIHSFEDLCIMDGVTHVFVCNEQPLTEMILHLMLFPPNISLTYLSPKTQEGACIEYDLLLCPEHSVQIKDQHELCSCEYARWLHGVETGTLKTQKCNFIIVRTEKFVRLVIFSDSLDHLSWEKLAQFGWYYDFPITSQDSVTQDPDPDNTTNIPRDECKTEDRAPDSGLGFKEGLFTLLRLMGEKTVDLFDGCDFLLLSPLLQILFTIPTKSEDPKFGQLKVKHLQSKIHWPEGPENTKNICQTSKFGNQGTNILCPLFEFNAKSFRSVNSKQIKIFYPPESVFRPTHDFIKFTELLPHFTDLDDNPKKTPSLHYLPNNVGVVHHANVYLRYQEVESPDGAKPRQYGYVMTGSQSVGEGSWGGRWHLKSKSAQHTEASKAAMSYPRYHLGVGIFPNSVETETEIKCHAFDLSQIAFHFGPNEGTPYKPFDTPFHHKASPHGRRSKDIEPKMCFIGVFSRRPKQEFGFVDPLPETHPVCSITPLYDPFPQGATAFLHNSYYRQAFDEDLPLLGTFIKFVAGGDSIDKIKVVYVQAVYKTEQEMCDAHGVELPKRAPAPVPDEDSDDGFDFDLDNMDKPKKEETFEEKMKKLNIKTDEEMDDYWRKKMKKKYLLGSNVLEEEMKQQIRKLTMAPTKTISDYDWMEKYVRELCSGTIPKTLTGPLSLNCVQLGVRGYRVGAGRESVFKGMEEEKEDYSKLINHPW